MLWLEVSMEAYFLFDISIRIIDLLKGIHHYSPLPTLIPPRNTGIKLHMALVQEFLTASLYHSLNKDT